MSYLILLVSSSEEFLEDTTECGWFAALKVLVWLTLLEFLIEAEDVGDEGTIVLTESVDGIDDFLITLEFSSDHELEDLLQFGEDGDDVVLSVFNQVVNIGETVQDITAWANWVQVIPDSVGGAVSLVHIEQVDKFSGGLEGVLVGNGELESEQSSHDIINMLHVVLDPLTETLVINNLVGVFVVETSHETVVEVVCDLAGEVEVVQHFLL